MSRSWENVYANLGDVADCLRDAVRTLRRELPHSAPGSARGVPQVDVQASLKQREEEILLLIARIEKDRSDFYLSHTPELSGASPRSHRLFGAFHAKA
ncbi:MULTISPECIES: hypothetical protein [unclassified Paraburkholderia]|uniref:hypothetical protein n=1 Tax=unclassified Paraburkholderia TaxID=2615204 RepID=UPI002AAF1990|nr:MULTISPECIES: hypothetical protein [unclassified Paraburkholderia]